MAQTKGKIPTGQRRSSWNLIIAEARRRLVDDRDNIPKTLKAWANDLSSWLATAHPDARQIRPNTVEIYVSHLHRIVKSEKLQQQLDGALGVDDNKVFGAARSTPNARGRWAG
jgi:hypothetical protein